MKNEERISQLESKIWLLEKAFELTGEQRFSKVASELKAELAVAQEATIRVG